MVFPGRLSTGCLLCRKRKVKCDELQPACRRCTTYGKPCPGYPEAHEFRSENERLQSKLNWPPPTVTTASCSNGNDMVASYWTDSSMQSARAFSTISTPLLPVPKELSLCYFMSNFIYDCPEDVFKGHLDFLPELYCDGRRNCQDLAILSVSYLVAFHKWRSWHLFKEARKHYGAAIISLQSAIQSTSTAQSDDTFAAALVLALFVDISNERKLMSNPHMYGIYQLLIFRGPEQLSTSLGRTLSGYALTQLCIEYFASKDGRYQSLNRLLPWFSGYDLLDRARTLVIRQIDLCCKFMDVHALLDENREYPELRSLKTGKRIQAVYEAIRHSFLQVEATDQWNRDAEHYWEIDKQARSELYDRGTVSSCDDRRDQSTASTIALMYSTQIEICWELLRCCKILEELSVPESPGNKIVPISSSQVEWLEESIGRSIREIVSLTQRTLPASENDEDTKFSSQPFGSAGLAHLFIWPAYSVARCPLSTPEQTSFCQQVLRDLGSSSGISTAYGLLDISLM